MRRWAAFLVVSCALLPLAAVAQSPQSLAPAQVVQPAQPKSAPPAATLQPEGNADVKVWVNTKSGVYHCPGTRWYGATKLGEYMKQSEAQQKGFRPAYHRACK
jgi:hypothetical protein